MVGSILPFLERVADSLRAKQTSRSGVRSKRLRPSVESLEGRALLATGLGPEAIVGTGQASVYVQVKLDHWDIGTLDFAPNRKVELHLKGDPTILAQGETDASGRFWFKQVASKNYVVEVTGPGPETGTNSVDLDPKRPTERGDVLVKLNAPVAKGQGNDKAEYAFFQIGDLYPILGSAIKTGIKVGAEVGTAAGDVFSEWLAGLGETGAVSFGGSWLARFNIAPGILKQIGTNAWESIASGLEYSGLDYFSMTRVEHVLEHVNPTLPTSAGKSLFIGTPSDVFKMIDEAWLSRGAHVLGNPRAYVVHMGRVVGTRGEQYILIALRPGSGPGKWLVASAYPVMHP